MAFGWSAGDIVAAINLLVKTGSALREAGGARDDYQSAADMLSAVNQAVGFINSFQSPNAAAIDPSILASVQEHAINIKEPITQFRAKVEKFENTLGKENIASVIKRPHWWQYPGKKLEWAFFVSKEAAQLTQRLGPKLQALQLLQQRITL
jgi:hypothetical protein